MNDLDPEVTGAISIHRWVRGSLGVLFFLMAPIGVVGQEPMWGGDLIAKIDSLAEATLAEGQISGFSVAVRRGNDLLLARGYGFADLENSVRAGAETVYGIGSVTKQFTAAAIQQLAERNLLSLDDPITDFLPTYSTSGGGITLRHLLTHTSGIPSYPSEDTPPDELAVDLTDEQLRSRFETKPLEFEPGSSFRYSNSAYLLLGMVIEAVSGQTYAQYLEDHIFEPLGLSRSGYCDTRRITPGRARGYWIEDNEVVNAPYLSMTHPGAAGALCSTVLDLLSWTDALRDGDVISRAGYLEMTTPAKTTEGAALPYGLGLRVQARLEGHANVSHGGGVNGYQSQLDYFPDDDLDVAVISNTNGLHVRRFADMIARWALGIPAPVIADESRSLGELRSYEGTYLVLEREWSVVEVDGALFIEQPGLGRARLKAQPDGAFVPANNDYTRLTFVTDDAGAQAVQVDQCVPTDHQRCRTLRGDKTR